MITKESVSIIREQSKTKFYCDRCGAYLGASIECPDGYIEPIGEFNHGIYVDGWYRKKRIYCNICREIVEKNFIRVIEQLGYKLENDLEDDYED